MQTGGKSSPLPNAESHTILDSRPNNNPKTLMRRWSAHLSFSNSLTHRPRSRPTGAGLGLFQAERIKIPGEAQLRAALQLPNAARSPPRSSHRRSDSHEWPLRTGWRAKTPRRTACGSDPGGAAHIVRWSGFAIRHASTGLGLCLPRTSKRIQLMQ
jgi:hypothetical protein